MSGFREHCIAQTFPRRKTTTKTKTNTFYFTIDELKIVQKSIGYQMSNPPQVFALMWFEHVWNGLA